MLKMQVEEWTKSTAANYRPPCFGFEENTDVNVAVT